MKYKWLYILFVLLNSFDLVVSYLILVPDTEANPIMRAIWFGCGYGGVIFFKALATFGWLVVLMFAEKHSPKFVLAALIFINSVLFIICFMLVYTWFIIEGIECK